MSMDLERSNSLRHEVDGQSQSFPRDQQVISGIVTKDSSRLHIGHNYHITYQCPGPVAHASPPSSQTVSCQSSTLGKFENSNSRRKGYDDDASTRSFKGKQRCPLDILLHSLGKLSESRPVLKNGEECGEITARLAIILDLFKQVEGGNISQSGVSNQIRAFRNIVERVTHWNINKACPRQQLGPHSQADSRTLSINRDTWQITLTTKIVKSFGTNGDLDLQTCYSLHVQPLHGFKGPRLAMISSEKTNDHQHTSLHPIILAYNEYPRTARIFELIAVDDLDGFVKYLAGERGSLRDCDEDGRSLLFYACLSASVQICEFLVENGAEVDRFQYDYYRTSHQTTALCAFRHTGQDTEEGLRRSLICRKALLRAGADPTIAHEESGIRSALSESLDGNVDCCASREILDLLLCEGSTFIDRHSLE